MNIYGKIAVHLAVACDVYDGVFLCCLFFPLGVLDEILNLIESVSEGFSSYSGGGRVVQRCLVNFQCRGVLLTWITVGQGPIVLAVGAGGGCMDIFSLIYHLSFLSPSLWETARYRLKYCLKGPLSPKQPTNQFFAAKCT